MFSIKSALSVRGPLIFSITVILVAGFLATSLISYEVSKRSLRNALIYNELPLTSNNIYSEIQRDLLQPVFVASLMSNDTFVKDWLLAGELESQRMIRYLQEIKKKYDVFTSFLVSDRTLNYYHFSGVSQTVSPDDPRDAWYFRVREMKEPYEINVDFNAEQGNELTIFINQKVFGYDGTYLASTGVGLKFDTLATVADRYKELFGRHVYFVNDGGDIMVRSDGASIETDNIHDAPGLIDIAKDVMTSDHGFFEYVATNGETMLLSTRAIPELKWRVIVELRESEALAKIRNSLLTSLVIGFAVIALTISIVAYTVNLFHNRLESMASTDRLTGIGNRAMFDTLLDGALKRFRRDQHPLSLILLDIDHFKRINDTLGHLEGDQVIRRIAQLIESTVREADTVCRWGGEEFIILANACVEQDAFTMAEKIRKTVEQALVVDDPDITPITISAGVTQAKNGDDASAMVHRADDALYHAKNQGRNQTQTA